MSDLIHAARPLTEFLMFPTFAIKVATASLKFKRQLMINESRILPREAHSCIFHSCAPKIVYGQQNAGTCLCRPHHSCAIALRSCAKQKVDSTFVISQCDLPPPYRSDRTARLRARKYPGDARAQRRGARRLSVEGDTSTVLYKSHLEAEAAANTQGNGNRHVFDYSINPHLS